MALSASVHNLIKLQSLERENLKLLQCDAIKNILENAVGEESLGWRINAGTSMPGAFCEHWDPLEEFEIVARKLLLPHTTWELFHWWDLEFSQFAVTPYGLVGLASSAPLSSSVISSALGELIFFLDFGFQKGGGQHLLYWGAMTVSQLSLGSLF